MYKKRTACFMHGPLYETKLLSLILFRAQCDHNIEEFYLGSNLQSAGQFDDICFKAKIKGNDRPLVVFLQIKHKDDSRSFNTIDLYKYFKSFLEIKQTFNPLHEDIIFNRFFNNTECVFVFYTNAKINSKVDILNIPLCNQLNDLIGTSMAAGCKLLYTEEDIDLLVADLLKDDMTILGRHFAKWVVNERYDMMMNDEYIQRYHVILARNVVQMSKAENHYRVCTFRKDFFDTKDKYLSIFKEEFCQNVFELFHWKNTKIEDPHIHEFLLYPSERTLTNIIGTAVTYKNNKLKFINNYSVSDHLKRQLSLINLSHSTIKNAMQIATINKLLSVNFRVPLMFGNTDLLVSGRREKAERRLLCLAHNILDLIEKTKPNCVISIDDTLPVGLLRLNGGLAGGVGNILVHDDESGFLKFVDENQPLEHNANFLLTRLRDKIDDIQKYRFKVNVKNFPKLRFIQYNEKCLAKEFYNKFMLWTEQASQEEVENILKEEIENHESYSKTDYFRIKSDAIFIKYHDYIQKWWMAPYSKSNYLTKDTYKSTVYDIVSYPLMSITSMMYMKRISATDYSFNEVALELFAEHFSKPVQTILLTNISILTLIKGVQCLKKMGPYEPVILDLKYILEMLTNEFQALISELKGTDLSYVLVLVFEDLNGFSYSNLKLQQLVETISGKQLVIIANHTDAPTVNRCFPLITNVNSDEKQSLEDLEETSRSKILNNVQVSFQGEDLALAHILNGFPMKFIKGSVLRKVILKESIVIGGTLTNNSYDKIKHLFVDRKVVHNHVVLGLRTLNDIEDDVVLIKGQPGSGKTTLLTHLAVKTKKINPKLWIVKISFLDCVAYFNKWQKHKTLITRLEMLKFMCQVVLQNIQPGYSGSISLEILDNQEVCLLSTDNDDEWATFELRVFLHFYMNTHIVFLFDGFDKIAPHYKETVVDFLNIVKNDCYKNKIWITSRLCKDVDALTEFATSYELKSFSVDDMYTYLDKFWKTNLIISNFSKEQIDNIKEFLDKTLAENDVLTIKCYQLGYVYQSLIYYLVTNFPDVDGLERWGTLHDTIKLSLKHTPDRLKEPGESSTDTHNVHTPLFAYLAAKYFAEYIKHIDSETCELLRTNISATSIYEQYVQTKLLEHFIHKRKVDIYNPIIKKEYEEEFQKLMKLYNT